MKHRLVLLLTALAFTACKKPDVLPESTFIESYSEILIIKTSTPDSTDAAAKVQEFLRSKNITKEQMQEQLKLYADDPARYRRVLEGINRELRVRDSVARIQTK